MGVVWLVGAKGCGKTTRAVSMLSGQIAADGRPGVVLDLAGVCVGAAVDVTLSRTVEGVLRELYVYGRTTAIVPAAMDDADAILRGVRAAGGGVSVLIDEARFLCNARSMSKALDVLMRTSRHGDGVTLILTSQRLGDLHQDAFAVADEIYVGRLIAPSDLDRAEREFGLPRERVRNLARGEFLRVSTGFDDAANDKAPDVPHHGEPPASVA